MRSGESRADCAGDDGGRYHLADRVDADHEAATDDDVMAAHQVLNILGVSEQSDECRHEEEGVQEG